MEASSSSRACCRIELLIGVSLEPENITGFLYVRGSCATTLLFHESPLVKTVYLIEDHPSQRGAEANKNPIILNLLQKEALGR